MRARLSSQPLSLLAEHHAGRLPMFGLIQYIERLLPDNEPAREHVYLLLTEYQSSGLAPPHLLEEIRTGEEQKFWASVWEAMLYRHFTNLGFRFRKGHVLASGQNGPDLGLLHEGRTIWIEAVVPKPEGLPADWLAPPAPEEFPVWTMPHEEMLLRWTSVLRDKNSQLKKRLAKDTVNSDEIYVVAVNACRLSRFSLDHYGITTLPFAVEAVFPIGPYAINFAITSDGPRAGPPSHTYRSEIRKPNNDAMVPTDNFFDRDYAGISALIGCSSSYMPGRDPYLIVVHNPLARIPLPRNLLGACEEYVAEMDGDWVTITRNP